MLIDKDVLDQLSAQVKANPRLRQSYDLRTTSYDKSQRMLNALEQGTVMPIHRHKNSSETMVMVRGSLIETFYDNRGNETHRFLMRAPGASLSVGAKYGTVLQIDKGQWHTIKVLEPGTVIFESKDGMYEQLSDIDILKI